MNTDTNNQGPIKDSKEETLGSITEKSSHAFQNQSMLYSFNELFKKSALGFSLSFMIGTILTMLFILKDLWI